MNTHYAMNRFGHTLKFFKLADPAKPSTHYTTCCVVALAQWTRPQIEAMAAAVQRANGRSPTRTSPFCAWPGKRR